MNKNNDTKENLITKLLIIGIVISIVLCLLFVGNVCLTRRLDINKYKTETINDTSLFDIHAKIENNCYVIEGYYCDVENNIKTSSYRLVLKDKQDNYYLKPTCVVYINDFDNSEFNEKDFGWAGFKSVIKRNNNEDNALLLLAKINDKETLVSLNVTIGDILENEK